MLRVLGLAGDRELCRVRGVRGGFGVGEVGNNCVIGDWV